MVEVVAYDSSVLGVSWSLRHGGRANVPACVERDGWVEVNVGDLGQQVGTQEQRERALVEEGLRRDAARCPAFAVARRSAVLAAYEVQRDLSADQVVLTLYKLHDYEGRRGCGREPSVAALAFVRAWPQRDLSSAAVVVMLAAYERARASRSL